MVIGRNFPRGLAIEKTCQLIGGIFSKQAGFKEEKAKIGCHETGHVMIGQDQGMGVVKGISGKMSVK